MASTLSRSEVIRRRRIFRILNANLEVREEDFASVLVAKESHDPFRVLIVTILSQSCTDISAMRAYVALDRKVGVDPAKLRRANLRIIQRSIRVAGLYRQKGKAIRKLSEVLCDNYSGDLGKFLNLPVEQARELLQRLPKVGPKTADVLLSIWGKPTISVDTHVERVSKRLGLTGLKSRYEEIQSDLMQAFNEKDYGRVPLLFMAHGRTYCKARQPLCPKCPVSKLCSYEMKSQ